MIQPGPISGSLEEPNDTGVALPRRIHDTGPLPYRPLTPALPCMATGATTQPITRPARRQPIFERNDWPALRLGLPPSLAATALSR